MLRNDTDSWGAPAKLFHWVMAALILAQIALGLMAANWRLSPTKIELFFWHKSTGMLILALVGLRILWRLANPTPELPAGLAGLGRPPPRPGPLPPYPALVPLPPAGPGLHPPSHPSLPAFWPGSPPPVRA